MPPGSCCVRLVHQAIETRLSFEYIARYKVHLATPLCRHVSGTLTGMTRARSRMYRYPGVFDVRALQTNAGVGYSRPLQPLSRPQCIPSAMSLELLPRSEIGLFDVQSTSDERNKPWSQCQRAYSASHFSRIAQNTGSCNRAGYYLYTPAPCLAKWVPTRATNGGILPQILLALLLPSAFEFWAPAASCDLAHPHRPARTCPCSQLTPELGGTYL